MLRNWLAEWKRMGRIVSTKKRSSKRQRLHPSRVPSQAEILEDRTLLAGVMYDAGTGQLDFTADGGEMDDVSLSTNGANSIVIVVGNGDAIVLSGDANVGNGFVLSTTTNPNDTLTIDTATSPLVDFNIDLDDMDDLLDFSLADTPNGVTNVNIDGGTGADEVTFSALTDIAGDLDLANTQTANLNDDIAAVTITGTAGTVNVASPGKIQDGIDIAAAAATLNVAAGLYTEDLVIDKMDLDLAGAGSGTTTIKGIATDPQGIFPNASPNINILASGVSLHDFTIESPDVVAGEYSSGIVIDSPDVEIFDNEFLSIQGDSAPVGANDGNTNVLIQTYAGSNSGKSSNVDGLHIHDNSFTGDGKGYYGVFVNPQGDPTGMAMADTVQISNNTFTGNIWRAIEVERSNFLIDGNSITPGAETLHAWGGSGISVRDFSGGTIDGGTISNNTISGADAEMGQGFTNGLLFGVGGETLLDITVTNNIVNENATGVLVNSSADGVTLFENDLSLNLMLANNMAPAVLNASGNRWGPTDDAAIFALLAGPIDFTPFLANGDADGGTPGFQGDFSTLFVTALGAQVGVTGRIQEAVDLVDTGGTVNVSAGTYTENVTVDESVMIVGQTGTIVDGDDAGSVFTILAGNTVVLESMTIQNGSATNGGGIDNSGDLTIRNSTVSGNSALTNGGGVFNSGGNVTVSSSDILMNTASGDSDTEGGGGIYSTSGMITIENGGTGESTVSQNVADGLSGSGGGIFMLDGTLVMASSRITFNTANRAGGGLEIVSGMANFNGNSRLLDNNVNGGGANPGNGGGVHISGDATVNFNNAIVANNIAANEGGGIWNSSTGTVKVQSTAVSNNTAHGTGGGGIFNNGGMLTVTADPGPGNISNNTASAGDGGGILSVGGTVDFSQAAGQPGFFRNNTAAGNGGGIAITGGSFTATGIEITGNTADGNGGGIFNDGAMVTIEAQGVSGTTVGSNIAASGGGIYNQNGGSVDIDADSSVTGNNALSGDGGGIYNTGAALTIDSGNVISGNSAMGDGGGIYHTGAMSLTLDGVQVVNNTAGANGGGISNEGATVSIENFSEVLGNTAGGEGGGVYNTGDLTVDNSVIGDFIVENDVWSQTGDTGFIPFVFVDTQNSTTGFDVAVDVTDTDGSTIIDNFNNGIFGGGTVGGPGDVSFNVLSPLGLDEVTPYEIYTSVVDPGAAIAETATNEDSGTADAITEETLVTGELTSGTDVDVFSITVTDPASTLVVILDSIGGTDAVLEILDTDGTSVLVTGTADLFSLDSAAIASGLSAGTYYVRVSGNAGATGTYQFVAKTVTASDLVPETEPNNTPDDATFLDTQEFGQGNLINVGGNTALRGGGIFNSSTGTVTVTNFSLISNNTATGTSSTDGGGGIYNDGGMVTLEDFSGVDFNSATGTSGSGGGIFNNTGGTFIATDAFITGNTANRAGGGIEDNSGAGLGVMLTNVSLDENVALGAPGNGGGLHVSGAGDVTIVDGSVSGNSAALEGGGLWNGTGTMTIDGTFIDGNTASGTASDDGGGGIFNNGGTLEIGLTTAVTISNNVADGILGSGGGIFNNTGGILNIGAGNLITGNTAERAGGGIEDASGNLLTLTNLTLTDNVAAGTDVTAPGNGGGLHITGSGDVMIDGGAITGNSAAEEGGGLWNGTGTMTIVSTSGPVSIDGNTASGDSSNQGGGGIFNAGGTLEIDNSAGNGIAISNNVADGEKGSGGGIFNDAGGTLDVTQVQITSNTANRAGGGIEDNSGSGTTVTLDQVLVEFNVAQGGGVMGSPGNGGGLHVTGAGDVTITGTFPNFSQFTNNSAALEGGGIWNDTGTMTIDSTGISQNTASGDASHDGGGGIFNNGGTLNIGSTLLTETVGISDNIADGTLGSGGGIFNNGGTVNVTGASIIGNTANRAGGGIEDLNGITTLTDVALNNNVAGPAGTANPGNGGGLHITGAGDVMITGGTVNNNTAAEEGGGLWNSSTGTLTVMGTEIDGNTALGMDSTQGGGGVFNEGGNVNLQSVMVTNNSAGGSTSGPGGGGIFNKGDLTLLDSTVSGNTATTGRGGGILNDEGATLTVINTTVSDNSASVAGGGIENNAGTVGLTNVTLTENNAGINGGGFHQSGEGIANIIGGLVQNNTAEQEGGGLWNSGEGTLTINGTVILQNTANGTSATQGGGGVFNDGGLLNISNATINQNEATGGGTQDQGGGGILNNGGTVNISTSIITNNTASLTGDGNGGGILNANGGILTVTGPGVVITGNDAGRAGGGIENSGAGSIATLTDVALNGNSAGKNGGGLHISGAGTVTVNGGTVNNNMAGEEGGGLWNSDAGTLTIQSSTLGGTTISGNMAAGDDGPETALQGGGGIFNLGGTLDVSEATLTENAATGSNNGSGGGILSINGMVTITDSTIDMNEAVRAGGGMEVVKGTVNITDTDITNNDVSDADLLGKGLLASPGNGGGVHVTATATVTLSGGTVSNNSASQEGGGLWNSSTGEMTINGTTIDNNTASGDDSDQGGGGVFNAGGTVEISNSSTISNNLADGESASGGGILNDAGGTLTVDDSSITGNTANRAGGGIEDNSGSGLGVTLTDVTLDNNTAQGGGVVTSPGNGGGLHVSGGGDVMIAGGTVNGNSAAEEGGGLWNSSGTMTINGTTIDNNTASGDDSDQGGGGVFNAGGTVEISNSSTISNNLADGESASGGGILNDAGGTLTVDDSSITGNTANRAGGGIEDNSGSGLGVTLTDVTLDNNTAQGGGVMTSPGNGGGLHVSGGGDVMITGGTTSGNSAAEEGGGLWNADGTMTINGTTIDGNTASGDDSDQGGGGVFNAGGTVEISNSSTISNNLADGTAASGGGILNDVGGTVTVTDSSVTDNTANRAGGGIEDNSGAGLGITLTDVTLDNNTAQGSTASPGNGGGLHVTGMGDVMITGGTVSGNSAAEEGGGLWNGSGTMTIDSVTIDSNTASGPSLEQGGGGIFNTSGGTVTLLDTTVTANSVNPNIGRGGGIFNLGSLEATQSTIDNNTAAFSGGIANTGTLTLTNVTVSSNSSGASAGGIFTSAGTVDIYNSTIANNQTGATGGAGGILNENDASTVTLVSTIVVNNTVVMAPGGEIRDVAGNVAGNGTPSSFNLIGVDNGTSGLTNGQDGNLVGTVANPIDPRLGPLADNGGPTMTHALLPDSPAINAGDNPLGLLFDQRGTPFQREFGSGIDPNQTDIGAFELQSASGGGNAIAVSATGPGITGLVQVVNAITQEILVSYDPFPDFNGGIRVAVADVNGDMTPDIITAAGPGGGPRVSVLDGSDFTTILLNFFAYETTFTGGVFVAAADLNDDDQADIITGADQGGGPHVKVFSGADESELFSFFAFDSGQPGQPGTFTGGVRVAAGDINDDGTPDIIAGAGPGGGPRVRVFDGSQPALAAAGMNIPGPLGSFFAYNMAFTGGVFVAAGDVNGDTRTDIITGAGSGGGPHVRVFDANTGTQMTGDIGNFFAYGATFTGGVRVAASDITGDGKADIITTPGPGGDPNLRAFDSDSTGPEIIRNILVEAPSYTGGLFVASSGNLESGSPLRLASGFTSNGDAQDLTAADIQPVFAAALARLEAAGLSAEVTETLATTSIEIADLSGSQLGESLPGTIRLDINAAGVGWFIDATPSTDEEFAGAGLNAIDPAAVGRVDLLTVILHELAHQLGGEDLDAQIHPGHILAESLAPSQRRLPDEDLDELFANRDLLNDLLGS